MHRFESANRLLILTVLFCCSGRVVAQTSMQNHKMQNGEAKLGQLGEFDLAVKDLSVSNKFYESLGFKRTIAAKAEHPVAALTDGSIVLTF
jgi:hypothetical protein